MSSHPKDATYRLFDVMAKSTHVAKQLHLPVQSGNDRVLHEMNRRYTRAQYLDLVHYAKSVMPGLVLTSDIIIGFPGETEAEAMETVELVRQVDSGMTIHDFRVVPGPSHTNLIFDAVLPFGEHITEAEAARQIRERVRQMDEGEYYAVVTVENPYV